MTQFCVTSVLPTFQSIFDALPDVLSVLPPLPTLPNPILQGITLPTFDKFAVVVELMSFQLISLIQAIVQPMLDLLGLDIDTFLPKIPYTDIGIGDFIAMDVEKIVAGITLAFETYGHSIFPFLPTPIYDSLDCGALEISYIIRNAVKVFIIELVNKVVQLIQLVTTFLGIPAMQGVPTFPTMDEIIQIILAASGFDTITALIQSGFSLVNFTFAGIDLPIPVDIFKGFSNYGIEFTEKLGIILATLPTIPLQIIVDFIESTLKNFMGFSLPLVCIDF